MKFEDFERIILEKDYRIVAMNHYKINGKLHTYCVILSKGDDRAFQAEGEGSEKVFENLYNQIIEFEKRNK